MSDDARRATIILRLGGYDFSQRNTNYMCADGRSFRLQLQGRAERWAVMQDGTNGLLFNLRERSFGARSLYGDGHILVDVQGTLARVLVDGNLYLTNCELRTWPFAYADGKSFILDVLPFDEGEAIFTDGTTRKRFTIYKQPVVQGTRYGDGMLRVDLAGDAASVFVEGNPYFADCLRQY